MRIDFRVKHDVETRRLAAELFADGLGRAAAAKRLSVPEAAVRKWQQIYRAFGSEVLLTMDGRQARYTYEQKVAAARAIVEDGMARPAAMAEFGIMSMTPLDRWCRLYREGGAEARELTREQELEERCRRLEAEVAYLRRYEQDIKSWKPLLHAYPRIRPTIVVSKPPAATPHSWKGLPMNNATTFVGLDVHARSIKACAFVPATGEVDRKSFGYEPGEVASWMQSLAQPAKCVYESGVTGFHLCRELRAMGVDCVIGAVSKMHRPAADRGRKTDRRDAHFLAVQLALGVVTEVHVPDPECEGARDLTRALADARDDAVRAKQRLSKFLLRHGYVYDERNAAGQRKGRWTRDFWAWVGRIDLGDPSAMATLDHYCERVRRADEEKAALEAKVKSLAKAPRWKPTCDALRCLKGIDAVTAVSIACEADGFSRFDKASGFAAWVGLVPSEHSSGESQCRGGITKAGNKHLRKLLVEAAWHYKSASRAPKKAAAGQSVPPDARRHANAGVRRLVDRRRAMDAAGKQSSVANVAIARELACWCWAVGRMAEGA